MSSRAGGLYGGIQFSSSTALSATHPQIHTVSTHASNVSEGEHQGTPSSQATPAVAPRQQQQVPTEAGGSAAAAAAAAGKGTAGNILICCSIAPVELVY